MKLLGLDFALFIKPVEVTGKEHKTVKRIKAVKYS
jgi:hypothetical protein